LAAGKLTTYKHQYRQHFPGYRERKKSLQKVNFAKLTENISTLRIIDWLPVLAAV